MLKRKTIEYSVEQFRDGDPFKIITLNKKKNKINVDTIGIENPNYVMYQNKNVRFISQSKVEVEVEEGDYDFLKYIENVYKIKVLTFSCRFRRTFNRLSGGLTCWM